VVVEDNAIHVEVEASWHCPRAIVDLELARVPAALLKRIDQAAKKKGISRSSFIVSSMADLVNGER
jgi:hypothetical protein